MSTSTHDAQKATEKSSSLTDFLKAIKTKYNNGTGSKVHLETAGKTRRSQEKQEK